jgi:hypothetical protein
VSLLPAIYYRRGPCYRRYYQSPVSWFEENTGQGVITGKSAECEPIRAMRRGLKKPRCVSSGITVREAASEARGR